MHELFIETVNIITGSMLKGLRGAVPTRYPWQNHWVEASRKIHGMLPTVSLSIFRMVHRLNQLVHTV